MTATIQGSKGGSDKQRSPVESPDSLVSIAHARLVDLVSEGEIFGLVNGANSIYLDETPGPNFSGFRWEARNGTQDQAYLAGFPAVENEVAIGVELRADSPFLRTISNVDLSAVRVTFSVPRLLQQNPNNGDTTGYSVQYAIDLAEGPSGPFVTVKTSAFVGKTTGGYERSERIDLPGRPAGGWRLRIRRLTPDSTSATIASQTNIKSMTEVIDAKFRYPNSAVIGLSFNAESFGNSVPRRAYHLKGRLLRLPSNYDAESRTYSGVWDGTFKIGYSNNPAWVYYDLLLHPRFGLGDRITPNQVDKWSLYQIAQYSDQMVDDGKGGREPRYTCNLYLQQRADALKVLRDIASVFRGITYWGAGQALVSADMPADPVYTYTNGSVAGGKFNYKGSKRSTRYSVALVSWNDPTDMYRAKVEYVQDDALVARFGVRQVELMNVGCTSQGQAQRAGRWALLTNQLETETISFGVGLEGIRARPGQIVRVADNNRAGRRIGGRVLEATRSVLTLDTPVTWAPPRYAGSSELFAGSEEWFAGSGRGASAVDIGDELTCILPNGTSETRRVSAVTWDNIVTVSPPFSDVPVRMSVWAHETEELAAQLIRIVSISETGPLEYAITGAKHVPGKYAGADNNTIISQRPVTSIPVSVQAAPTDISVVSDWQIDQYAAVTTMTIRWAAAENATRYDVEWRRGDADWVYAGRIGATEVEVPGIYAGGYQVRVKAINSLNIMSVWSTAGPFTLQGKTGLPPAVTGLTTTSQVFGIRVTWGVPVGAEDTAYTELQMADSATGQGAIELGRQAYPTLQYLHSGMAAAVVKYFRARLVDKTGNVGPWSSWVQGISSAQATEILDYLTGQITETQLGQTLLDEIKSGGEAGAVIEEVRETVNDIDAGLSAMWSIKLGVRQDGTYYAAGMGIGIENTPAGMQSQVLFLANRFAFLNPGPDGTAVAPFVIENGQTIISDAVIGQASISWLKIGDDVQSDNYIPGQQGWRLAKNGNFEINGVVPGQGRMAINNRAIKVFDSAGTVRVQIGDLEA